MLRTDGFVAVPLHGSTPVPLIFSAVPLDRGKMFFGIPSLCVTTFV
jgi:hypothetical protein